MGRNKENQLLWLLYKGLVEEFFTLNSTLLSNFVPPKLREGELLGKADPYRQHNPIY